MLDDFTLFKEEVKTRVDIVDVVQEYVDLKRGGANYTGLCPFHTERTPSFSVNREKQFFHCFGCGKGGDVIGFLMDITGMTFIEALEQLADRAGLKMPERTQVDPARKEQTELIAAANLAAAEYYYRTLPTPAGAKALEYLTGRGLTQETIRNFRLGFAPVDPADLITFAKKKGVPTSSLEAAGITGRSSFGGPAYHRFGGRVIFPIIDQTARVLGFGGRILEGEGAKYVNSPDSPVYHKSRVLFGLYQAKNALKRLRTVYIVEGYMDVISLHQAGITTAIAASGTSFTTEQARMVARMAREAVLLFDGDKAGIAAAARGADTFLATDLAVKVVILPEGHDPDSYVRAYGPEALGEALGRTMDIWEFKLRALADGEAGVDDRLKLAGEVADSLSYIPDELKREVYITQLAPRLGVDIDTMRKAVGGRLRRMTRRTDESAAPPRTFPGSKGEHDLLACIILYPALARRLFQEAGMTVFPTTAIAHVADVIHNRLVEGLDVSPSAIMGAIESREEQELTAHAASRDYDEELAGKIVDAVVRSAREREMDEELRAVKAQINKGGDPKKLAALRKKAAELASRLRKLS